MFDHYEFMGWGGAMGFFWLVLLIILVLLLGGWLRSRGDERPGAREILDRRYANGEIDREEYRRRLDDLES